MHLYLQLHTIEQAKKQKCFPIVQNGNRRGTKPLEHGASYKRMKGLKDCVKIERMRIAQTPC